MDSDELEELTFAFDSVTHGDSEYMRELADKCIQNSAYWYSHPKGPARAPKHAERMDYGNYGLEIEFGANTFLVEVAIRRSIDVLRRALESVQETGDSADEASLKSLLSLSVQGAVANYLGEEYAGLYNASDGFMHFGAQAIHVASFVDTIWDDTGAYVLTG